MKNTFFERCKRQIVGTLMVSIFVVPLLFTSLGSLSVANAQTGPPMPTPQGFSNTRNTTEAGNSQTAPISTGNQAKAVIITILKYVLGFLAALTVLVIVISGIMYITAGGDEDRVENAKRWLLYAIIGLTVALLGWVIVNVVDSMLT